MNIIKTDRFIIRNWIEADAEALVEARKDSSITKGLGEINNHPYTLAYAIEHINSSQGENNSNFVITIDNSVAGEIGSVFRNKPSIASTTYWILQEYRIRGIATEALIKFTEYIFEHHPVQYMEVNASKWNAASIRVLEKAGYILKGDIGDSNIDIYHRINSEYIWKKANNISHVRKKKSVKIE